MLSLQYRKEVRARLAHGALASWAFLVGCGVLPSGKVFLLEWGAMALGMRADSSGRIHLSAIEQDAQIVVSSAR